MSGPRVAMSLERMPGGRVFVPARTEKDLTIARRYGPILYILDGKFSPFNVTDCLDHFVASLYKQDYHPRRDWFLIAPPILPLSLCSMWMMARYGRVRALMFHSPHGNYLERLVPTVLPGDF